MYLCSLRTITLAVGIFLVGSRSGRGACVGEKGSGGNVSDPMRAFTMAILQFPVFFKKYYKATDNIKNFHT